MPAVCLYFQAHQPFRLRRYPYLEVGKGGPYEDEALNRRLLDRVARRCYLPANDLLMGLIDGHGGRFRFSLSLSGCLLDQLELWRPDVLESFRALAGTGAVEFLGETDSHSLAFVYSPREFVRQVEDHAGRVERLFGHRPVTFRHTELIYSDEVAAAAGDLGFEAILAEGAPDLLGRRTAGVPYRPAARPRMRILLRNARLSDDVAFRFSRRDWEGYPLTAERYAAWIRGAGAEGGLVNLFMDYETFGEHQWEETGIFAFLAALPGEVLKGDDWVFATIREAAYLVPDGGELPCPRLVSWADQERDLSAWAGNAMQRDALETLYSLEPLIGGRFDSRLHGTWRRLQTSDHFYYMSTKGRGDGEVHGYFNPYASPHDAYINYMNVLDDFAREVRKEAP
ncbi:MAG TPA: glycoside hydrolase family 57 protein [Syntrophales bacterium]|nr:glycoside hydrolase family 57 protein [Syntrophales bacterium]